MIKEEKKHTLVCFYFVFIKDFFLSYDSSIFCMNHTKIKSYGMEHHSFSKTEILYIIGLDYLQDI
jgi:hypothetical protein